MLKLADLIPNFIDLNSDYIYHSLANLNDFDSKYGTQCPEFVKAYVNYIVDGKWDSSNWKTLDGKDVWKSSKWSSLGWTVFEVNGEFVPQPGDIFCAGISAYTHTGVVISATSSKKAIIADGNGRNRVVLDGDPVYIHEVSWVWGEDHCYGPTHFIRPKFKNAPKNVLTITYKVNGGKISSDNYMVKDGYVYKSSGSKVAPKYPEGSNDIYDPLNPSGLFNASTFGLSKKGYKFIGWSKSSKGSGTVFGQDDGNLLPIDIAPEVETKNTTVTLYAVWKPYKLAITFNANGASTSASDKKVDSKGNVVWTSGQYAGYTCGQSSSGSVYNPISESGGLIDASTLGLSKSGYAFVGWCKSSDGTGTIFKQDDTSVRPIDIASGLKSKDVSTTLYAIWKKKISTPSISISRANGKSNGKKYTGKPKITWSAISNAKEYAIYRATSKDGTYTKIGTTTKTSYTNSSASAGKTYYYKVKAITGNSKYANSSYSSKKSFTCTCSAPSLSIALVDNKPKLTWDAVTGAKEYEVYRATSKNGTYKLLGTTTKTSYHNKGASKGKKYFYKVRAINKTTTSANSGYSSIKNIKSK